MSRTWKRKTEKKEDGAQNLHYREQSFKSKLTASLPHQAFLTAGSPDSPLRPTATCRTECPPCPLTLPTQSLVSLTGLRSSPPARLRAVWGGCSLPKHSPFSHRASLLTSSLGLGWGRVSRAFVNGRRLPLRLTIPNSSRAQETTPPTKPGNL